MAIRVLIADDHGVLRAGLRALLNSTPDIQVVAEAGNGEEALELCARVLPDIILLDVGMPGLDGIEVTARLRQATPAVRALIMTMHEDSSLLRAALQAGAAGYIVKRAVEYELIAALYAVHRGELYVHPALTRSLFHTPATGPAPGRDVAALTPREIEILRLIAEGYTNRQVAEARSLSVRTVESHRASIMGKLDLHSRVELVRYAAEHGLLREPE